MQKFFKYICVVIAIAAVCGYYLIVRGWPYAINDPTTMGIEESRIRVEHGSDARLFRQGYMVVYQEPGRPKEYQVSRVIAIEGEHVTIGRPGLKSREGDPGPGVPCVDGKPYRIMKNNRQLPPGSYRRYELIVPRDHIFLLGDSRQRSEKRDSVQYGPIPLRYVRGWKKLED